ncbi:Hpt domain-containing protein [Desulfopila aestuarii]|nr:Hpt domain-containing protein [Desulfopila aestuarii]
MAIPKEERIEQIQEYLVEKFHLPREQISEMLPNFIGALVSHMDKLDVAFRSGDLIALGRAGHTMKGALLNLGINDCVDIAFELEQKGKAMDTTTDYSALLGELRERLGGLIR